MFRARVKSLGLFGVVKIRDLSGFVDGVAASESCDLISTFRSSVMNHHLKRSCVPLFDCGQQRDDPRFRVRSCLVTDEVCVLSEVCFSWGEQDSLFQDLARFLDGLAWGHVAQMKFLWFVMVVKRLFQ